MSTHRIIPPPRSSRCRAAPRSRPVRVDAQRAVGRRRPRTTAPTRRHASGSNATVASPLHEARFVRGHAAARSRRAGSDRSTPRSYRATSASNVGAVPFRAGEREARGRGYAQTGGKLVGARVHVDADSDHQVREHAARRRRFGEDARDLPRAHTTSLGHFTPTSTSSSFESTTDDRHRRPPASPAARSRASPSGRRISDSSTIALRRARPRVPAPAATARAGWSATTTVPSGSPRARQLERDVVGRVDFGIEVDATSEARRGQVALHVGRAADRIARRRHHNSSRLIGAAGAEWVSAPTEMKSTPGSA